MSTMLTFSVFSVIFLAIGIVLYVLSEQIFESSTQYNEHCQDYLQPQNHPDAKKGPCPVPLEEITSEVKGPVYVYYQLNNFYQNHRRYVKSRDSSQLNGNYLKPDKLGDCDPIVYVSDLWDYQQKNIKNKTLKPDDPAIPCGLVAKSVFNDTYVLKDQDGKVVNIVETGIAWSSDIQYKFKNIENAPDGQTWEDVQWLDMTNGK